MATKITVPTALSSDLRAAAKEAALIWASYPNGEYGWETNWKSKFKTVRLFCESFAAVHGLAIKAVAGDPHSAGRITLS